MKQLLITIVLFVATLSARSQITCHIFSNNQSNDTVILCEGQPLNMAVVGSVLADDFNTGSLSSLWSSNCSPMFSNPCGPPVDGTVYLWVGSAMNQPRYITTVPVDVNIGYQVCFDMIYAVQSQSSPCEGPDLPTEGVHLQYSLDGSNWVDMNYWPPDDPNCSGSGGYDQCMTNWKHYCEDVPLAATSSSTQFQWHQDSTSTNIFDHWGIDNVFIGDTICSVNWYENGTQFANGFVLPPNHPVTNTSYTVEFICGTDTLYDSLAVIIDTTCIVLSGYAYIDDNLNCNKDSLEQGYQDVPVQLYLNNQLIETQWTDYSGYYKFSILPDTGSILVTTGQINSPCLSINCPFTGYYIPNSVSQVMNFGLQETPGFDLSVNGYATGFIPGAIGYIIAGINSLCDDYPGQLIIYCNNPLIHFLSYSFPPAPIIGDSVTWDFFNPNNLQSLFITYYTDTTATLGDNVCIDFYVLPIVGDLDTSNNHFIFCIDVNTSYDPNDKNVTPRGVGTSGYILPDIPLTYTINFQNTGTAPAQKVIVIDTLDININPNSVEILDYSHSVNTSMYGNILEFKFLNIMLPDSGTNFLESHGHVTYKVDQLPNLAPLTQIHNSAGIYFDYNAPVITNQTLNTIMDVTSVLVVNKYESKVKLFPNPVHDVLNVVSSSTFVMEIMDVNGHIILKKNDCGKQSTIDISGLKKGVYIVRTNCSGFVETARLIKL